MPDTVNMAAALDTVRDAVAQEFERDSLEMQEEMRELISIPVEYNGRTVIRSIKGEAPRKDSGALYESIRQAVEVGLYGVEMSVSTDKIYSVYLQGERFDRPHWSTLYENWKDVLPGRVAQSIGQL